jgi:cytidine deaminase
VTNSTPVVPELESAARQAAAHAYCPYSHFPVGAAVLTARGEIFSGCNVENASYGLTICAERNAVFQAVAHGARPLVIRAVVVFTPTAVPTAPCGACRQVLNEFGPDAEVVSVCDGPVVNRHRLAELLPTAFGPKVLGDPAVSGQGGPPA